MSANGIGRHLQISSRLRWKWWNLDKGMVYGPKKYKGRMKEDDRWVAMLKGDFNVSFKKLISTNRDVQ